MKSHDMRQATALSAMVQGIGYLLASIAPSLIGALYDWQQAWTLPMLTLVILLIAQAIAGWPISGSGKVDEAR
jgi:CP family cyanate transporter-like MFS transporter